MTVTLELSSTRPSTGPRTNNGASKARGGSRVLERLAADLNVGVPVATGSATDRGRAWMAYHWLVHSALVALLEGDGLLEAAQAIREAPAPQRQTEPAIASASVRIARNLVTKGLAPSVLLEVQDAWGWDAGDDVQRLRSSGIDAAATAARSLLSRTLVVEPMFLLRLLLALGSINDDMVEELRASAMDLLAQMAAA